MQQPSELWQRDEYCSAFQASFNLFLYSKLEGSSAYPLRQTYMWWMTLEQRWMTLEKTDNLWTIVDVLSVTYLFTVSYLLTFSCCRACQKRGEMKDWTCLNLVNIVVADMVEKVWVSKMLYGHDLMKTIFIVFDCRHLSGNRTGDCNQIAGHYH